MAAGEGLRGLMPRGLYRAPGSAVVGAQARPAHGFAAAAAKEKSSMQGFLIDFAAGGTSGAIAKTCTAPIERVKLIIQTQDANPKIISGEVARYTSIGNCFTRVYQEQGLSAFWRGNFVNVLRYFPTQAFNFAFKDSIKAIIVGQTGKPKSFAGKLGVNVAAGGLAGAGSLCIVYPLDYGKFVAINV